MAFIDSQCKYNVKKYIQVLVQLKLMLQQHYVKFARTFEVLIIFFASIQSSTFILRPIFDHSILKGHLEFLDWIMYFARFDLFIIDFIPRLLSQYYFIMPFAVILIFEITIPNTLTVYQLCECKHSDDYMNIQAHNQSFFISFWLQSYSIYGQLFIIFLKVPFYILLIHQVKHSWNNNQIEYLMIAMTVLFLLMLTHLCQFCIFQESDSLQVTGFQILNFSISDVILEMLLMSQIIIYATVQNPFYGSNIQAIFILAIASLRLVQVIFQRKYPINSYNYTIILTESIKITYTICWLTNYTDLICIIILPLIYILLRQYQAYQIKIFIEIEMLTEIKDIRAFMAYFVNESFNHRSNLMILQSSIMFYKHKQKCQVIQCDCQKHILVSDDPTEISFYRQEQLMQIYLTRMRSIYSLSLNSKSNISLNNTEILYYAQILNQFGQPLMALQLCANMPTIISNQQAQTQNDRQKYYEIQTYRSLNTIQQNEEHLIINKRLDLAANIRKYETTWLMNIKFESMIQRVKQQLYINFELQSDLKKQSLSYYMQKFVDHERRNEQAQHHIVKIIQKKIQLYQILNTQEGLQAYQMFKSFKQIGQMALDLEVNICKQFDVYPSVRQQSMICFFYAEIMNNLFAAFRFASLTAMSEEKLMNLQINTNVFSKEINYMIVSLDKSYTQFQIEKYSNNLHSFFGYQYEFFKEQSNVNFLLPIGILQQQRTLISEFIQKGKSKYFRDQALSFYRDPNQFMKPFKMMVDVHYKVGTNVGFVAFFDQCQSDSAYILVDNNNIIGGITQSMFEQIGYTKEEIIQYAPLLVQQYQCHITQVIPKFEGLKFNQQVCKMRSIKLSYFRENISAFQSRKSSWWNLKSQFQTYNISIQIHSYECNQSNYYILQIDNILAEQYKDFIELETNVNLNSMDEEVQLLKPMESFGNYIQCTPHEIGIHENQMLSLQQSCRSPDWLMPQVISPNQETSRIMNTSRMQVQQQFFTNPSKEDNINSISVQINKQFEESDKVDLKSNLDEKRINQKFKQNDNKRADDLETSATTKIRKSILFNKYDLISKTTNKIGIPKSLISTYATVVLFTIISAIYYIIVLTNNTFDMSKFIQEAQLLGVHSAFMAPLDNYQAMRVQIIQYQTMYRAGNSLSNVSIYANYTNWLSTRLQDGYNDMQNNFQLQFANPYTTQFYINNYIIARFQYTNQTVLQSKNITFEESLFVMLSYQFSFKGQYRKVNLNNYQQNSNQSYDQQQCNTDTTNTSRNRSQQYTNQYGGQNNQPYFIYAMANYFNFHNKFDDLSQSILTYSLNRQVNVKQQWIQAWAAFIAVNVFIIVISYYFYRLYIRYYEQFIDLYKYLETSSLQREIERYQLMIGNIQKDSNILFRYHFDLEQKEGQILEQKNTKESPNIHIKFKSHKRYRLEQIVKFPYMLNMIAFGSFIVLFVGFSLIIQIQNFNYLDKYSKTAQLYVCLSDITYIIPGLYFQRNLADTISSYTYFNQSDVNELYSRIAFGLQTIQNFQIFLMNYDSSSYLSDEGFNAQLSNMNTLGVCDYLDEIYQKQVSQYCPLAFQGALKQGYQYSLNYIYHSLQNEQQINNFTNQIIYNLYEVEGAYILMRATQGLQQNLYHSISAETYHSINTSIEISIIYIIIVFLILLCLFYFVIGFYENEYFIIRRSILLLPIQTLFLDDVFERSLRFISFKDAH